MHRQTVDSYNASAERWRETRRAHPDTSPMAAAASAFRGDIGEGLILDLGCGPGATLHALGDPVIGVDAALGMLALVDRTACPVVLVAADIEELPIAAGSTAGAFGSFSFQHLPRKQFDVALREVTRVLQPGGLLELWMHSGAGVDGVRANDDMGIGRWFTYWSAADLEAAIPRSGLEVVAIDDHEHARRTRARRPVSRGRMVVEKGQVGRKYDHGTA